MLPALKPRQLALERAPGGRCRGRAQATGAGAAARVLPPAGASAGTRRSRATLLLPARCRPWPCGLQAAAIWLLLHAIPLLPPKAQPRVAPQGRAAARRSRRRRRAPARGGARAALQLQARAVCCLRGQGLLQGPGEAGARVDCLGQGDRRVVQAWQGGRGGQRPRVRRADPEGL